MFGGLNAGIITMGDGKQGLGEFSEINTSTLAHTVSCRAKSIKTGNFVEQH